MKKSIYASVLMLAIALTSCSSDDNSTPEPTTKDYLISFNHERDLNTTLSDNDFQLAITVVAEQGQPEPAEKQEAKQWEILSSSGITTTYHYVGDKNRSIFSFGANKAKSIAISYVVNSEVAESTNFKSNLVIGTQGKQEKRSKQFSKDDNIWNLVF